MCALKTNQNCLLTDIWLWILVYPRVLNRKIKQLQCISINQFYSTSYLTSCVWVLSTILTITHSLIQSLSVTQHRLLGDHNLNKCVCLTIEFCTHFVIFTEFNLLCRLPYALFACAIDICFSRLFPAQSPVRCEWHAAVSPPARIVSRNAALIHSHSTVFLLFHSHPHGRFVRNYVQSA